MSITTYNIRKSAIPEMRTSYLKTFGITLDSLEHITILRYLNSPQRIDMRPGVGGWFRTQGFDENTYILAVEYFDFVRNEPALWLLRRDWFVSHTTLLVDANECFGRRGNATTY